ncbi:hypothetical protein OUZ56_010686 [Daphnia magna]|uniref:SWIM-type domain-containing protein n=1 Tax=Daphnia magna TaxID=35525 RepID=A0ABQ9YYS9_9CRUS|nr:hypothetical protein OUZ56_010686 [Daphnia magna]
MEEDIKIMKKKSYDFVLNKETSTYNNASRTTTYHLKSDLTACTCDFFMAFELPCRHIISFHIQENTEIPTGSFAEHWRNECLEDDATVIANRSSPIGVHKKKKSRKPKTEKDQFMMATTFFLKLADTLSG